ncbi:glycosyl transferase, partial [Nostoc linckia z15]
MNTMRKRKIIKAVKTIAIVFTVLLILLLGGFYIFRNTLLKKAIARVEQKMATEYHSTFKVKEATFNGLSGISMKEVLLVPHNADTLLSIREMSTSVNLGRLLTGDVQLGTLVMKDGFVQLVKNENGSNFSAFLKKNQEEDTAADDDTNYARRAYRLLNRALNLVPTDMELVNLSLRLDDRGRKLNLQLRELKLSDEHLESSFIVRSGELVQNWKVKGMAD